MAPKRVRVPQSADSPTGPKVEANLERGREREGRGPCLSFLTLRQGRRCLLTPSERLAGARKSCAVNEGHACPLSLVRGQNEIKVGTVGTCLLLVSLLLWGAIP